MEMRVNLAFLAILGAMWVGGTVTEAASAMDVTNPEVRELAALEDRFAVDTSNVEAAEALASAYLDLDRPDLVVATASLAHATVLDDPAVSHRLAQAFESLGRVDDALATAELALSRCERTIGTARSSLVSPLPARVCSERTHVALEIHHEVLGRMSAWGVVDPRHDPRAERAYALTVRTATIMSASR